MSPGPTTLAAPELLVFGSTDPDVLRLAGALGVDVTGLPEPGELLGEGSAAGATPREVIGEWPWGEALDQWRVSTLAAGSAAITASGPEDTSRPQQVVVAAWVPVRPVRAVVELDLDVWVDSVEAPIALWSAALGVAVRQVADGGVVVAVVDRPSPLDCAGHGPETAVADAVEAMVRSLGRSEGPRGVRVNLVTTPVRTAPGGTSDPDGRVVAPPPPLDRYPGTIEDDVAGAVRMLLGPGAVGLTGTVLHADSGRSWR